MIQIIKKLINKNSRFIRYCIGGGFAFLVDLSLLYILTEYVRLWYLYSATLSFVVTAMVNYTIQKYWTFKNSERKIGQQFLSFLIIQVIGLLLNNLTLYIFVEFVGLWYMLAKILAAGLVLIWNYWAGKKFVFKADAVDIVLAGEIFPPEIGGPATYTYRLAEYFLAHHINFVVLYYSYLKNKKNNGDLEKFLIRINGWLPIPIKYFIYFLRLFSRSIHAKVIYAQGPVASGWPALMVSKLLGKKLVVKVVGDYAWEQARLAHVTVSGIDGWQKKADMCSKNYFFKQKIKTLNNIERLVVRHATAVIVPSDYLKKIVLGWGADESNVKVIYNSVALKNLGTLSKAEAQEKIKIFGDLIITVARLLPWKGMEMLIKIMPELLKLNPKFKLLIAGRGPEEDRLKKIVEALKIKDKVFFLGNLRQEDLAMHYLASSIFLLNSGYEGLSHAILDAMYYNLPIIVSDIGGNPELIQDDYNGLLVEYNNASEWIKAIEKIWGNERLRLRLSANPLSKLDVFSFDSMMRETLKILN